MIPALVRKLLRDLVRLRGQVVTIALVVAAGIASFVTMRGNYASIEAARDRFYAQQRFGHVFVQLERAPDTLLSDIEALPGVARAEARVAEPAMLPLPELPEPVRGRILSLSQQPLLNLVHVRDGRLPEPDHSDEAVLLQAFADAQKIRPGDRVPVVMNGKRRELVIVGIATSPEYVMAMAAGSLAPDPERFAVLWMARPALAAAFQMEASFNDLTIELRPGASEAATLDAVDRLLVDYGGLGAYGRALQTSNHMIEGELLQLSSMATVLPAIFLAVAALLVNLVLSRLVHLQQPEIATLKALGYSNRQVGLHFLELVLVVSAMGSVLGVALGSWLGGQMIHLYSRYFKFAELTFQLDGRDTALAVAISILAAAAGAFGSVRRATAMPPAEAMRPPSPARYRASILDRLGLRRLVGPVGHMIVRELERRPLRTLLSSLSIAAATALTVIGGWYYDGVEVLFTSQFHETMREDAAVTFLKPRPARAVREIAHIPGVLAAEGLRLVPVRFRAGHHQRDGVLWGYPEETEMRRPRDAYGRSIALPPSSVVLTVVYNNARVALSMRGRDLASLRVLGFTRGEISTILLGEQLVQVLAALPVGLIMGRGLVVLLARTVDPETYRLPLVLTSRSYAFAAAVTLVAAAVSALLVRRRLDQLDLVAVLKTRE